MRIVGIIPARYASTRLEGKPLCLIGNKTMLERVFEQASKTAQLSEVWIATDDDRIYQHAQSFTNHVLMTDANHPSGTDRCAEAITLLPTLPDVVINIQGDEPFLAPEQLSLLIALSLKPNVQIGTLVKTITHLPDLDNPAIPKVVIEVNGKALYFSRNAIPHVRDEVNKHNIIYYNHVGLYGFKTQTLLELVKLPPSMLEQTEKLEQLRWLENGFTIHTALTHHPNFAIDTLADLEKARLMVAHHEQ